MAGRRRSASTDRHLLLEHRLHLLEQRSADQITRELQQLRCEESLEGRAAQAALRTGTRRPRNDPAR